MGEAIKAANTDAAFEGCPSGSGDDVIRITVPGTINAPTNGFDITSNMTIQGDAAGTTIQGTIGFVVELTKKENAAAVTAVTLADLTLTASGERRFGVNITDETESALGLGYTVTLENLHIHDYQWGVRVYKDTGKGRVGHVRVKESVVEGTPSGGDNVYLNACDYVGPVHDELVLTISDSVIRNDPASDPGNGIGVDCGYLKVVDSMIVGNKNGIMAKGGEAPSDSGSTTPVPTKTEIINSTIANNTGPGVIVLKEKATLLPKLSVVNSTISGNNTASSSNAGGGIATSSSGGEQPRYFDVDVFNSVVAGNGGRQCELADTLVDDAKSGNASSDTSCGFEHQGVTPRLQALAVNGNPKRIGPNQGMEPVKTMAIDRSSPLFNAVKGSHCPRADARADARGVPRPQGSGCDIGAYEAIVVGDMVWDDVDGDGRQDPGEKGVEGVTVQLLNAAGRAVDTVKTDSDGVYGFPVGPGDWTVKVTDTGKVLVGRRATTPTSVDLSVTVADVAEASEADFGYQRLATVGGVVWVDSDRDGVRDEGEPGLKGVAVKLLRGGSEAGSAKTNAEGCLLYTSDAADE